MTKLKPGYYEIKPKSNTKQTQLTKQKDDMYYTYTTRDYNSVGEEIFQIHIHEPETFAGKIKHKLLTLFHLE